MIAYLEGKITYKSPTYIYVDCNGVGYHVNISLNTYAKIEQLNKTKILTYLHVKEDIQALYGFSDESERGLFVHLISVSGIGPNTARIILSSSSPEEVRSAIANEQVQVLNKIKGVGPKTAKRIILDLKEKIVKEGLSDTQAHLVISDMPVAEAVSALTALGFQKTKVQKQISKMETSEMSVEDIIKTVLQQLSN